MRAAVTFWALAAFMAGSVLKERAIEMGWNHPDGGAADAAAMIVFLAFGLRAAHLAKT